MQYGNLGSFTLKSDIRTCRNGRYTGTLANGILHTHEVCTVYTHSQCIYPRGYRYIPRLGLGVLGLGLLVN